MPPKAPEAALTFPHIGIEPLKSKTCPVVPLVTNVVVSAAD